MEETLLQKLNRLADSDMYPFHMPGHKRRMTGGLWEAVSRIDITEIDGFDNLHHAQEILKEEQEFAARLFGSRQCFFLVNGSSCGVMAAICSAVKEGEKILMVRGSHLSAYHAVELQRLLPRYLYPQQKGISYPQGAVTSRQVAQELDNSHARVVFLTSPTYEGIISDVASIAKAVHDRGALLIVDEAHGAHLGFHEAFGESAVTAGADIVIQSLHKTMPAMTQTALLHICSDRIDPAQVQRYLRMFQTSSPSYVMMASISHCLHTVSGREEFYFAPYVEKLTKFYRQMKALQRLKVLDGEWASETYGLQKDPSKIVIFAERLSDRQGNPFAGYELMELLRRKYHLEPEMAARSYVLCMTSILDTQEGFDRLADALLSTDRQLCAGEETDRQEAGTDDKMGYPPQICSIYEAVNGDTERIDWRDAVGRISAEYVYLYPPGTPVVVPGEQITASVHAYLEDSRKKGLSVQGPSDETGRTLRVMKRTFDLRQGSR